MSTNIFMIIFIFIVHSVISHNLICSLTISINFCFLKQNIYFISKHNLCCAVEFVWTFDDCYDQILVLRQFAIKVIIHNFWDCLLCSICASFLHVTLLVFSWYTVNIVMFITIIVLYDFIYKFYYFVYLTEIIIYANYFKNFHILINKL